MLFCNQEEVMVVQVAAIWAVAFVLVCGAVIWRADRGLQRWFQITREDQHLATAEAEIALMERRAAAEIAALTTTEAAELRKAELALQTAEANDRANMVTELHGQKLKAEQRLIAARAAAYERLAVEFARAEHEAGLANSAGDIIEQYRRLVEITSGNSVRSVGFLDFLINMQR